MDIQRPVVSGFPKQRHHPLRLAQRIDADEMGPVGVARDRGQKFGDFAPVVGVAKDREGEGGLGDEEVARHNLEAGAGPVRAAFVVAGDDDARAAMFHHDLSAAEDVARGRQPNVDLAEPQALPVPQRLVGAARTRAEPRRGDGEGFRRREHGAVTRPGMVAVAVRHHRSPDAGMRIDVEIARHAIETFRRYLEPGFGFRHLVCS